jgi:hypothetical protein
MKLKNIFRDSIRKILDREMIFERKKGQISFLQSIFLIIVIIVDDRNSYRMSLIQLIYVYLNRGNLY